MNRYYLIRRLRGPAFLLLLGVVALLHKLGVVEHTWNYFWPLCLILLGVLMLLERAALHSEEAQPYPGVPPYPAAPATPAEPAGTAMAPAEIMPPQQEGDQQ